MDIYDSIFDETYESVLHGLYARSEGEREDEDGGNGFSLETVKGELDSLCKYDGLNWTGRGSVKQAEIEGSILAYQAFILRYRENQTSRSAPE